MKGRGPAAWVSGEHENGEGGGSEWDEEEPRGRPVERQRLRRSVSMSSWEALQSVESAADIILKSGYPLREYEIMTSDGYLLKMERIPRKGACCS